MPLDSKHLKASFSPTSTDLLYIRVAKVPKSQDLVIFVDDNDNNNDDDNDDNDNDNDMTNYFTPCACARGNNYRAQKCLHVYQ